MRSRRPTRPPHMSNQRRPARSRQVPSTTPVGSVCAQVRPQANRQRESSLFAKQPPARAGAMRLPSSLAKTGEVAGLGREPRFPLPERLCAVRDEPGVPAVAPVPGTFPGGCYGTRRASWDSKTICLQALGRPGAVPVRRPGRGFRLRTGPCRALGADTPRDAELRGDLACSRLGSERKYVKRIYARDTGKARRQFAR